MTPEQRERWRVNLQRWRAMSPEQRQRLRQRWQELQQLPPEQRQRLLQEPNAPGGAAAGP
jgi:hypothetical protein